MPSHDTIPSPQPPDATDATLDVRSEHESIQKARELDERLASMRRPPDDVFPHDLGPRLVAAARAGTDSHETTKREQNTHDTRAAKDAGHADEATQERDTLAGNVPPASGSIPPADAAALARARASAVTNRLLREGRWKGQAETTRNDMMATAKRQGMTQEQAQLWVYAELDRMYPPVQTCTEDSELIRKLPDAPPAAATDSGAIQGLSDLPSGWPELPSNASLAVEIGWVQANRLRVVDERPGRATVVRLDLALSPAPSWAALGWLETSIRSYAKFVDVAAKVSGGQEDEGAVMRRERKSIEEVRALMQEMMDAEGTCPHCGRPY